MTREAPTIRRARESDLLPVYQIDAETPTKLIGDSTGGSVRLQFWEHVERPVTESASVIELVMFSRVLDVDAARTLRDDLVRYIEFVESGWIPERIDAEITRLVAAGVMEIDGETITVQSIDGKRWPSRDRAAALYHGLRIEENA